VKVLVLSNLYPPDVIGGYEIACAQAVDALRERGHAVWVLTAAPRTPVPEAAHVLRRLRLVEETYWSEHDLWFHPLAKTLRDAESRFVSAYNVHLLTAALEELEPDVVYVSNLIGLGGLALIACLQYLTVPWVWQLGDNVPVILCRTIDAVYPVLADEFSRQIEGHYIVVSQQLLHQIESQGVTLRGDVEVIPYWIVGERPRARTSFYRGGTLRIMSAGQVARHKGTDTLIEAAARLRDWGCTDFVLDVYGKAYSSEFAAAIAALQLESHVRLRGARTQRQILALYEDYDVLAFPSLEREPFGLVPLEAAARGCVPLVARCCGIAEWLVDGVHCLKAPRRPESFAGVFRSIMEQETPLAPIAHRAQATAWRDFHLSTILPRIERKLAVAARQTRAGKGNAADAYRLARMAEQMTQALFQEAFCSETGCEDPGTQQPLSA
jgi:glycosyltransferase involved in cell wall biosynthesis